MNAMLTFAPFLALVAFLSVEVTAEVVDKHATLTAGNFTDGFLGMNVTYMGKDIAKQEIIILPAPGSGGCTGTLVGDDCDLPVATNDGEVDVEITALVPAAAALDVAPKTGAPSKIIFKQCFSPQSTSGRKWRKINDPFEKDNSCKTGSADIDIQDYPKAGGPVSVSYKLGAKTPKAELTIRAYVQCDKQSGKQYCHVNNFREKVGDEVYFPTDVIDNRPAGLFTAVLICAFIGPLLLAAFLIYERGILAKQA